MTPFWQTMEGGSWRRCQSVALRAEPRLGIETTCAPRPRILSTLRSAATEDGLRRTGQSAARENAHGVEGSRARVGQQRRSVRHPRLTGSWASSPAEKAARPSQGYGKLVRRERVSTFSGRQGCPTPPRGDFPLAIVQEDPFQQGAAARGEPGEPTGFRGRSQNRPGFDRSRCR